MNNEIENNNDKLDTKEVNIGEKSIVMDINIIEAPLFNFNERQKLVYINELIESSDIDSDVKEILSNVPENLRNSKVGFRKWFDSNNNTRALLSTSMFKFPNAFCMDVLYALIYVYTQQQNPIIESAGKYNLSDNKVRFKLKNLCEILGLNTGGTSYRRVKDALRRLDAIKYYSLHSGSLYNKSQEKYISSKEKSINLIDSYELSKDSIDEYSTVALGELILSNLMHKHIKFLEKYNYFALPTGLSRRLYSYIEGNSYDKPYIKRSFEVLRYRLPIDFDFPYVLKRRLKNPLETLIEAGIISDYFYGDEFLVNGIKEQCIYFIFKGNKHSLIKELEEKNKVKGEGVSKNIESEVEEKSKLEFPKDIKVELKTFGINEQRINILMNNNTKYELAKYILWMKDGIKKGKVKDPAGLFVFAMTPAGDSNGNMVKVENTHAYIVQFIEAYKREIEGKNDINEKLIIEEFNIYIENELSKFKEEDEFAYIATKEAVVSDIEAVKDKKIKSQRQLYNMATNKDDKDKILLIIEKWEAFSKEKEFSEIFKEMFIKRISSYRGIDMYEEFKRKYIQKNS